MTLSKDQRLTVCHKISNKQNSVVFCSRCAQSGLFFVGPSLCLCIYQPCSQDLVFNDSVAVNSYKEPDRRAIYPISAIKAVAVIGNLIECSNHVKY